MVLADLSSILRSGSSLVPVMEPVVQTAMELVPQRRQTMIEDMQQYIKEIRQMVSGRLDMTRNLEDEEIRDTIAELVAEESRKQYMTLTEKREVIEGVFNSMRGWTPSLWWMIPL